MSTPNTPQQPHGQPGGAQGYPQAQPAPGYVTPTPQYGAQPAPQATPAYPQVSQQSYRAPSTATTFDKTNTLAVLSILFAFISPLLGIILGHIGLGQIKRNGDAGRGLALTGLIISYAYFVFITLFLFIYIGFFIVLLGSLGSTFSDYSSY